MISTHQRINVGCYASLIAIFLLLAKVAWSSEDNDFQNCTPPIETPQLDMLNKIEYYGGTSIPESAFMAPGSILKCRIGNILAEGNKALSFSKEGKLASFQVGEETKIDVIQGEFNLSKGTNVELWENGLVKESQGRGVKGTFKNVETMFGEDLAFFFSKKPSSGEDLALLTFKEKVTFTSDGRVKSFKLAETASYSYFGAKVVAEEGEEVFPQNDKFKFFDFKDSLSGIIGDWTLDPKQGNLKISVDSNGQNLYQIFLLKGDYSVITVNSYYRKIKAISPLVKPFFLLTQPSRNISVVRIPTIEETYQYASEENPLFYRETAEETPFLDLMLLPFDRMPDLYASAVIGFSDNKLTIKVENQPTLYFTKDNWIKSIGNFFRIIFQASISLIFFVAFIIGIGLIGFRKQMIKLFNSKVDKRYKDRNKLRGGGTRGGILLLASIYVYAAYFGYHVLLMYVGAGSLTSYLYFFRF